jgi:3-(3-hydroxy-phenyl)propionate hydroxylase
MDDVRDLIIVGCGPVGAVAANLAARAGLSTTVLERATEVYDLPRAIHFDAHIMRILQQAGVAEEILASVRVWRRSTFYGADGEPIRVHDWGTDRRFGWDAHYLFYQPTLEAILRRQLDDERSIDMRLGIDVVGVDQDSDGASVQTIDRATRQTDLIRGRYLLAADGASSFVRSSIGVDLIDTGFDEPWLVIDVLCDREIGRPDESEMFCDPRRPATRVPGPGRHHRWEFMLLPGETAEQIQSPESIAELLRPWVSIADVQVVRASVYRFHALVARRWRDGRIFLCGDAAHQTPPFLGQGLCHGVRDVQNLLWKVGAALRGAPDVDRLLDTYEAERRPHVARIIDMAVAAGRDICVLDPEAAAARDVRMRREAQLDEAPRTTFQGMPPLVEGLLDGDGSGELFPQPVVRDPAGDVRLMDDVVGDGITVVALAPTAGRLAASGLDVTVVAVGEDAGTELQTVSEDLAAWFSERAVTVAVLRPDRYVYAATDDVEYALTATKRLSDQLLGTANAADSRRC